MVDLAACKEGAALLYNVGTRNWGVKHVRGKIGSLLEDGNYFYGQRDAVPSSLSQVMCWWLVSGDVRRQGRRGADEDRPKLLYHVLGAV